MAAPVPPRLDDLGQRPFSFYPPIIHIDHNEWIFQQGSWSEILIRNPKMGIDLWLPRSYLGEVSKIDEPVMIVGLKRELEYKGGAVWPYQRRVIPMPPNPVTARANASEPAPPAPKSRLGLEGGAEQRVGKLILITLLVGLALLGLVAGVLKLRTVGGDIEYRGVLQADLGFTTESDYFDVVRKLGQPDEDRWKADTEERQYRILVYKKRDLVVVLMGAERASVRYIGAKDLKWRTVHAVELPDHRNTEPILRALPRF